MTNSDVAESLARLQRERADEFRRLDEARQQQAVWLACGRSDWIALIAGAALMAVGHGVRRARGVGRPGMSINDDFATLATLMRKSLDEVRATRADMAALISAMLHVEAKTCAALTEMQVLNDEMRVAFINLQGCP